MLLPLLVMRVTLGLLNDIAYALVFLLFQLGKFFIVNKFGLGRDFLPISGLKINKYCWSKSPSCFHPMACTIIQIKHLVEEKKLGSWQEMMKGYKEERSQLMKREKGTNSCRIPLMFKPLFKDFKSIAEIISLKMLRPVWLAEVLENLFFVCFLRLF